MTRARTQWDRLLAIMFAIAGAVVLATGWFGVSGTAYPAEQMPYLISAGLGGLFLLGVSAVLWLSADLHDEWRKLDRIENAVLSARADADQIIDKTQIIDETRELSAVGVEAPS
ncbi:hypothetical protein [Haloechinothrix salitolerans]